MILAIRSLFLITIFIPFFSCQETVSYKPSSAGKMDEVLWVLADENLWNDTLGISVQHTYLKTFPVLPQPEPSFLLRQSTYKKFDNDISKRYRNIVFSVSKEMDSDLLSFIKIQLENKELLNRIEDSEFAIFTLKDVWAKPQNVIFIVANDKETLQKNIVEQDERVKNIILKLENEHLYKYIYKLGENKEISKKVKDKFSLKMILPKEYYLSYEEEDFAWIRKETADLSSNIMIYNFPFDGDINNVDWKKYALDIRLYLGQNYISSQVPDSYMILEDFHAPVVQRLTENDDKILVETRALWKIKNDFMGGPFINYFWINKETNTLYMIDGFVHAPRNPKKQYIRQLENIFSTAI